MLNFSNVTLRRGTRKLWANVNFTVYTGQRVGVVGRNGTGKSSLFALVLNELATDLGEIQLPKNIEIASVAQEMPSTEQAAIEYVLDGDSELREIEAALDKAEQKGDYEKSAPLYERLNSIGGYAAPARAGKLLHGLGFHGDAQTKAVKSFSGGWRMRLNLARALMKRSQLLLLDEPTNHLDLDAVIWLQDWLRHYQGTLLLISHDREFLDAVTTHTLHVQTEGDGGSATMYTGNYSAFELMRAERMAQQTALHETQQKQVAHLQKFVDRFRASATKAKQAQARVKMIERIQLVAPAHADSEFRFQFFEPPKLPSPLIRLDEVAVGYGTHQQLSKIILGVEPGDRIALLGPNGAGKSTLVKLIAGELKAMSGQMTRASDLKVGYFAQHQLEYLDLNASPMLHFQRLDDKVREQDIRNYLGGFNFKGDRVYEEIEPFSGGEKARLALALVVYQKPNLLLLDEPTNHLDLDMRHALEMSLHQYSGAVILVSHDRHLVSSVSETLWRVSGGRVTPFDGDLDDYASWLMTHNSQQANKSKGAAPKPEVLAVKKPAAENDEDREAQKKRRQEIRQLDQKIEKLSTQLKKLEKQLADPALYDGSQIDKVSVLTAEQAVLRAELTEAEEVWLSLSEELA